MPAMDVTSYRGDPIQESMMQLCIFLFCNKQYFVVINGNSIVKTLLIVFIIAFLFIEG